MFSSHFWKSKKKKLKYGKEKILRAQLERDIFLIGIQETRADSKILRGNSK